MNTLRLLSRDAAQQRAFGITTAPPGEGKTLAELGEAFAWTGKHAFLPRVLMSGGGMRRRPKPRPAVNNSHGVGEPDHEATGLVIRSVDSVRYRVRQS